MYGHFADVFFPNSATRAIRNACSATGWCTSGFIGNRSTTWEQCRNLDRKDDSMESDNVSPSTTSYSEWFAAFRPESCRGATGNGCTVPVSASHDGFSGTASKFRTCRRSLRLKANDRERERMHSLNAALGRLRDALPVRAFRFGTSTVTTMTKTTATGSNDFRWSGRRSTSKIATLRAAQYYIRELTGLLASGDIENGRGGFPTSGHHHRLPAAQAIDDDRLTFPMTSLSELDDQSTSYDCSYFGTQMSWAASNVMSKSHVAAPAAMGTGVFDRNSTTRMSDCSSVACHQIHISRYEMPCLQRQPGLVY